MDIHQLKTFVVVARERSITRASESLFLSQPAVSAHIKAMEEDFGFDLFQRTPRGMALTPIGERLLAKAELALAAHQEVLDEATRNKGALTGKIRLGAGSNSDHEAIGRLLTGLSGKFPGVSVELKHGTSMEILAGIRSGNLDAGFYNHPGEPDPDLEALEVSTFRIYLAAAPGLVKVSPQPDWKQLAELPWIYPTSSACCGRTAEDLFKARRFRPHRIVNVDRQDVSKALITGGMGIGLLHAASALEAEKRGEVDLLYRTDTAVRIYFAHLANRKADRLLSAASALIREKSAS